MSYSVTGPGPMIPIFGEELGALPLDAEACRYVDAFSVLSVRAVENALLGAAGVKRGTMTLICRLGNEGTRTEFEFLTARWAKEAADALVRRINEARGFGLNPPPETPAEEPAANTPAATGVGPLRSYKVDIGADYSHHAEVTVKAKSEAEAIALGIEEIGNVHLAIGGRVDGTEWAEVVQVGDEVEE